MTSTTALRRDPLGKYYGQKIPLTINKQKDKMPKNKHKRSA